VRSRPATHLVILVHGTEADAHALREDVTAVLAPMGLRLSEARWPRRKGFGSRSHQTRMLVAAAAVRTIAEAMTLILAPSIALFSNAFSLLCNDTPRGCTHDVITPFVGRRR
jgi:hypothetical protein